MTYEVGDVITDPGSDATFTVQMWTISDILNTVTESADFPEFDGSASTWAYLIASKGGDEWTPVLAEKILEVGFTDPICIYRTEFGGYGLGNGHHRLVAAFLLGLDSIPVLYTDTNEYYPDASEGPDFYTFDPETSEIIYNTFTKIYKKLQKQEARALAEESQDW